MALGRILFPSGHLKLQAILHIPDASANGTAAVVCHPHPLYGGTMHNNVVVAICRELSARGAACLRFNYRGVEDSQGAYGGGVGEVEDACAALDEVANRFPAHRLVLAGYSFGGGTALAAAYREPRVEAVAVVSPAAFDQAAKGDARGARKLVIAGKRDGSVEPGAVERLFAQLDEPKTLRWEPEADHFWMGKEAALARAIGDFLI